MSRTRNGILTLLLFVFAMAFGMAQVLAPAIAFQPQAMVRSVGPCQASQSGTISVLSFYPLDTGNYNIPYATNSSNIP